MSTFKLPDLGEGLAEAEILEWHVKVGDHVKVDQLMLSVETAKSVVEVPAPCAGVVSALHGLPGDIVPTGAPLVEFDSGTVVGRLPQTQDEDLMASSQGERARAERGGNGARDSVLGNERGGARSPRARAIPAARALAKHLNVDLATIEGRGPAGLVTLDDVLSSANSTPADPLSADALSANSLATDARSADLLPASEGGMAQRAAYARGVIEPLRGMRRAMAHSMSRSRDQVAGSTVCDDADIHPWIERGDYMLRLLRAMVSAWRIEPALNAWYDPANASRVLFEHVDLAIAIDTPGGLIVPVIRDVQDKTAVELRAEILVQKTAAYERRTPAEDLRGFTLMLSNFGTLAGRYGIPLVVPPAVAILGAGKVRQDAVVVDGEVRAHRRMPLSLSFDHRCITGGEACRFLAAVIADLEKPD